MSGLKGKEGHEQLAASAMCELLSGKAALTVTEGWGNWGLFLAYVICQLLLCIGWYSAQYIIFILGSRLKEKIHSEIWWDVPRSMRAGGNTQRLLNLPPLQHQWSVCIFLLWVMVMSRDSMVSGLYVMCCLPKYTDMTTLLMSFISLFWESTWQGPFIYANKEWRLYFDLVKF